MHVSALGDLTVRGVSVRAGSFTILHNIQLDLRPGEMCGLIGPSGSGKSTLIKVLLGLREPDEGSVDLGGKPGREAGPIGYVPQEDALHMTLTVREALYYTAALRLGDLSESDRNARIEEVCRQVGLDERLDVRIRRLSGGQRKRVSVAMELLTRPPVLILDEPTSGLDPGLEARMMELFAGLARQGRIVLVSTHTMESLGRCDALLVLAAGHVAYCGLPGEALAWFQTDRMAGLFDRLNLREPAAWQNAWMASPGRAAFRSRPRLATAGSPAPQPAPAPASSPAEKPAKPPQPALLDEFEAFIKDRGP